MNNSSKIFIKDYSIFRVSKSSSFFSKKEKKHAVHIVASFDLDKLERCLLSIDNAFNRDETIVSVLFNGFNNPKIESMYKEQDIDSFIFKKNLIDLAIYNDFNSSTALARHLVKEETKKVILSSRKCEDCFNCYIDPDMEFTEKSAEMLELVKDLKYFAFGHRGGYFDFNSENIDEYMFYNESNQLLFSDKITTVAGFFLVGKSLDYAVDYVNNDYPYFWFDDNDRAFRFKEKRVQIGLVPKSYIDHFSPHAASSTHKEIYQDEEFLEGKKWLKAKWHDTGKIDPVIPDIKDRQFDKEGEII